MSPEKEPEPLPTPAADSYLTAFEDLNFLRREELRPVRLLLEIWKPELIQDEQNIQSTIVAFGGSRILEESTAKERLAAAEVELQKTPESKSAQLAVTVARNHLGKAKYYDEARKLAAIVSSTCQLDGKCDYVVMTGGGPGIMEAANRGADDVGAKSVGLNITLPFEQSPNPYITPELSFQFYYFATRKMHFLMRAKAVICFPGGYGTLDELFETLTLIQTGKIEPLPLLLFGEEFWSRLVDFQFLVEQGTIAPEDVDLFSYVETAEEAWQTISAFYDTDPEQHS